MLPVATLRRAYEHRDTFNPRPTRENARGLFQSINRGNAALPIHACSGDPFADDSWLDGMNVWDDVRPYFRDLDNHCDYQPAHQVASHATDASLIDVDILAHVFEQSRSDLPRAA